MPVLAGWRKPERRRLLPADSVRVEADDGIYIGQMRNGRRHGTGVLRQQDGKLLGGTWKDGKAHGMMTRKIPDGAVITVAYSHGVASGHCRIVGPGADFAEGLVVDGAHYGIWWYWTGGTGFNGRYRFHGGDPIEQLMPWGLRAAADPSLAAAGPDVFVPNPQSGDDDLARTVRRVAGGLAKLSGLDLRLLDCILVADNHRHGAQLLGRAPGGGPDRTVFGELCPGFAADGMPVCCWVVVERAYVRRLGEPRSRQQVAHVLHHELAHASDLAHKAERVPDLFRNGADGGSPAPGAEALQLADVAWSEYYAETVTRYSSRSPERRVAIELFKRATVEAAAFMRPAIAGGFGRQLRPSLDRAAVLRGLFYATGQLCATLDLAGRAAADLPEIAAILRDTELTGYWARMSAALRHAAASYADWDVSALDGVVRAVRQADALMVER